MASEPGTLIHHWLFWDFPMGFYNVGNALPWGRKKKCCLLMFHSKLKIERKQINKIIHPSYTVMWKRKDILLNSMALHIGT